MSVLEHVATDINDYGFSGSINKFTLSIIAIRQIIFREMHFCDSVNSESTLKDVNHSFVI